MNDYEAKSLKDGLCVLANSNLECGFWKYKVYCKVENKNNKCPFTLLNREERKAIDKIIH